LKTLNPDKILNYHHLIKLDSTNEYNSWKHCYYAFANPKKDDVFLALHLGFYLASWGMYRGSTAISHKDYTIHIGAVKLIKQYYFLRCNENYEIVKSDIPELLNLYNALRQHYYSFDYLIKGALTKRKPTDTLISKIVIGTLGCSPAFDRYFNDGAKSKGFNFIRINQKCLEGLFIFKENYKVDLIKLQNKLLKIDQFHYPIFKLIDNYFWHEGYALDNNKN
tara:strand:- start:2563 stop:3228 length:666 start_codon:yes stop_codon:yes gene_type:complete